MLDSFRKTSAWVAKEDFAELDKSFIILASSKPPQKQRSGWFSRGKKHNSRPSEDSPPSSSVSENTVRTNSFFEDEAVVPEGSSSSNRQSKITFGVTETIEIDSLKSQKYLWWSKKDLEMTRQLQRYQGRLNPAAQRYMASYQEAHSDNLGTRCSTELPDALINGLQAGLGGMEDCSELCILRRVQAKRVVREICLHAILESPSSDEEIRSYYKALNQSSTRWAVIMGEAYEEANKVVEI